MKDKEYSVTPAAHNSKGGGYDDCEKSECYNSYNHYWILKTGEEEISPDKNVNV